MQKARPKIRGLLRLQKVARLYDVAPKTYVRLEQEGKVPRRVKTWSDREVRYSARQIERDLRRREQEAESELAR
jgi:hypothetical protein